MYGNVIEQDGAHYPSIQKVIPQLPLEDIYFTYDDFDTYKATGIRNLLAVINPDFYIL